MTTPAHRKHAKAIRETSKRGKWPEPKANHPFYIEEVKWRVWVGWNLRAWRRNARSPSGHADTLQSDAARWLAVSPSTIALMESGHRQVTIFQLMVLAHRYGHDLSALLSLFEGPDPTEWMSVLETKVPDARYAAAPVALRAPEWLHGPRR